MKRGQRSASETSGKTRLSKVTTAWSFIFIPLVLLAVFLAQVSADFPAFLSTPQPAAVPTFQPTIPEKVSPSPLPSLPPQITAAPEIIPTAVLPTLPSQPALTVTPTPLKELIRAHLSYYWPPFGEINCDTECEHIATGDDWHAWVGKGVACPVEYPLGTVFIVMGDRWECIDRGEAIVVNSDGSIWLDFLNLGMPYPIAWGTVRTVEVLRAEAQPASK